MKKIFNLISLAAGFLAIFQLISVETTAKESKKPSFVSEVDRKIRQRFWQLVKRQKGSPEKEKQTNKAELPVAPQLPATVIDEKVVISDYNYGRDYKDLLKIHEALDDASLRFLHVNDRQFVPLKIQEFFPNAEGQQQAALEGKLIEPKIMRAGDGRLIGAVSCGTTVDASGKTCNIDHVVVNPEFQGRGFGKKLMQVAIDFFASKGCERVELQVVSENPAKNLYTKMGFVVDCEGLGHCYMHKDLQKAP